MAAVPHSHSYYQIIWFFDAGGTHVVDFRTYQIQSNTVLFIGKDQIHAFDENLNVNGWLIHFNEGFFMHSDVDIFLKYTIFNTGKNSFYVMDGATGTAASNFVAMIREELFNKGRFGYGEIIRFLLKSFLINLERMHRETTDEALTISNAYALQFYRFRELVESNYAKQYTMKEYANALNISTKTLVTICNAEGGKSPSKIVSERRILQAQRLLRYTALQVGEIAFRLGFEDVSYFIRFFKRHMGNSPNEYRKK